MPDDQTAFDLYRDDIALWADHQADLLRRLEAGEQVVADIDWRNVIEEIELVGGSERSAVDSLLGMALLHLLKMHGWPDGPVEHWRIETRGFLRGAAKRWAPSVARVLDVDQIYREALEDICDRKAYGSPRRALPPVCPFTLTDLISSRRAPIDIDALLAKLTG